jgi:hypothetical protein
MIGRWVVIDNRLEPLDQSAFDFLNGAGRGEVVECDMIFERDIVNHRRIFGIIGDLAKALRRPPELVRAYLLWRTGNFTLLGELRDKSIVAVNSMSRHAMKDHELHAFWDEAKDVIKKEMLCQIPDPDDLARVELSLQAA